MFTKNQGERALGDSCTVRTVCRVRREETTRRTSVLIELLIVTHFLPLPWDYCDSIINCLCLCTKKTKLDAVIVYLVVALGGRGLLVVLPCCLLVLSCALRRSLHLHLVLLHSFQHRLFTHTTHSQSDSPFFVIFGSLIINSFRQSLTRKPPSFD